MKLTSLLEPCLPHYAVGLACHSIKDECLFAIVDRPGCEPREKALPEK
jgi:hypothetical protein